MVTKTVIHFSRLSFSRSCGWSVCASRGDSTIGLVFVLECRWESVWVWERKVFHGDQGFSSSVPPRSSGNGLLPVRGEVERDKEQQIGAENAHASESGKFFSRASTNVRRPWEIAVGKVGV